MTTRRNRTDALRVGRAPAWLAALSLAGSLAGCGGSADEPSREATAAPAAAGSEEVAGPRDDEGADGDDYRLLDDILALFGNPNLTVYADGPRPVELEDYGEVEAGAHGFRAAIRVVNEGSTPAEIATAHIAFEVWGDGERRLACSPPLGEESLAQPPVLEPNEAHELAAVAACPFPGPGDYEVRSYVSFEAIEPRGDFEIERHYAGTYELTVE